MKNHQYLTSGIIEGYLLGLVSKEEKDELERVLITDPDVLTELNELEVQMEQYFLTNAVPPPPGIKVAIEQRIYGTEIQKKEPDVHTRFDQPTADTESPRPSYIDVEVSNTHIRVHKNWRTAFIAIFILSKVFLILGLYYYFKSDSQEQEIRRLKADVQQLAPLPRGRTP
ncbi:hypothetical protein [Spirosoma arcticum]